MQFFFCKIEIAEELIKIVLQVKGINFSWQPFGFFFLSIFWKPQLRNLALTRVYMVLPVESGEPRFCADHLETPLKASNAANFSKAPFFPLFVTSSTY